MWCVFELAVFLRTRKNPEIEFVSLDVKMIEVVTIAVVLISQFGVNLLQDLVNANATLARTDDSGTGFSARDAYLTCAWVVLCVNIFVTIVVYVLGERHFTALYEMRNTISNYDVNHAQLSVDADRDFLLKIVDDLFSDVPADKVRVDDPGVSSRRSLEDGELEPDVYEVVDGDVFFDDEVPLEVEAVEVVDASEPLVHSGLDDDVGDLDARSPGRHSIAADGQLLDADLIEGHALDGETHHILSPHRAGES